MATAATSCRLRLKCALLNGALEEEIHIEQPAILIVMARLCHSNDFGSL
jgi:hypothetical protein